MSDFVLITPNFGRRAHGGTMAFQRRKARRPLSLRGSMHVVLSARAASGPRSFLQVRHRVGIEKTFRHQARKFAVRVDRWIATRNQIHMVVRLSKRAGFQNFLRSSTAMVARQVTGARRGRPFGRFWDGLVFTQCLRSDLTQGRCWNLIERYVSQCQALSQNPWFSSA